jgi:asparagine synthase (glutamine-hydrolysing)
MCGIAGIAASGGVGGDDPRLVDRMLHSLAHRGPDDHSVHVEDRAILGSRRLSIIDLAGGRQPLSDESGRIQATQNGEIYNYVELRAELEAKGHRFRTRSDTETLAHLYEEHGPDFVQHLRGMFAIALWDGREGRLVLARDRLGKKPLYWRFAGGRLTYGSELKAILQDPTVEREVDRDALAAYLQFQYVPAPRTILHGVNTLPAAGILVWDGGEPRVQRYWTPAFEPKTGQSFEDDVEQGVALMREAVRIRLRSDVPVGVFLSGGMDSSVVTALMAQESAGPVRTFSIGFANETFDELPYARAVAERYGTNHTEEVVDLDALSLLPKVVEAYDEPFGDPSMVPTFRVAQMAAEHLKVVLTGDGGDESFGGYSRYRVHQIFGSMDLVPRPILRAAARTGRFVTTPLGARSRLRRRLRSADALFGLPPDDRYVRIMTILDANERNRLMPDRNGAAADGLLAVLRSGPADPLERMLRADLLTYLPDDLLVKMDRATMANSLEARAPLLDHHLVEWAARLPVDRKVDGSTSKVLLRAIAKRLMPAEHVDRPKMGFTPPVGDWFRGELGTHFRDTVLAADAASRDHLDPKVAGRLLAEHQSGEAEHEHQLWVLLMFELWARRWLRATTPSIDAVTVRP